MVCLQTGQNSASINSFNDFSKFFKLVLSLTCLIFKLSLSRVLLLIASKLTSSGMSFTPYTLNLLFMVFNNRVSLLISSPTSLGFIFSIFLSISTDFCDIRMSLLSFLLFNSDCVVCSVLLFSILLVNNCSFSKVTVLISCFKSSML